VGSRRAALALFVLGMAEPRVARATETGETARVPVHFATTAPGVTIYSRSVPPERLAGEERPSQRAEFTALCEAPCDATLDPTVHEFALAPAGSAPIPAKPAFELRGDARFRADVISHASTRTTGWWILGALGTAGATSTTIGLLQTCVDDQSCQEWTSLAIWSGIAAMTAGVLIGVPKIVKSDEATLTLVPATVPPPNPAGARFPGAERGPLFTAGATLVGSF
jgi:hypothetical protein